MRKILLSLAFISLFSVILIGSLTQKDYNQSPLMKLREQYPIKHTSSVDHSKFDVLKRKFNSPQEVTATCISCHNQRHKEIMASNHWNWEKEEFIEGRGIVLFGKKTAINNFCIGSEGNETTCAKCHIGYGMDIDGKIFTDTTNVDCMVCHDNSGLYSKAPEMAGAPLGNIDFNKVAQSVGKPTRDNCGVCHFFGGGGNNVKHGDLDMVMSETTKDIDVHMAIDGANIQCIDCHTTDKHNISGKLYSLSSMNYNRNNCEQCHTETPHKDNLLNEHTIKVACQTCHIPEYAKENSTKMSWDWSTTGKMKDGKPYQEKDSLGNITYMSTKGSFTWAKNIAPDYMWFNGKAQHYIKGDKIKNPNEPLILNQLLGSYSDEASKIVPVKTHIAKQPYDPVNQILIKPLLYSPKKGVGAYWKDFDWLKASEYGMKEADLPFSGKMEFIETVMYWPVNHMVSSVDKTVTCNECHTRDNGRLASLTDFYLPGRDYSSVVDGLGKLLLLLTFLAVATHGTVRYFIHKKNKRG